MLTRKMLAAMEIDADKVTQIIEAHAQQVTTMQGEIDDAKAESDKYKAEAEKLMGVQKELNDLKAKVEADAKEREGKDYDALKKEFEEYKEAQAKAESDRKKTDAYKEFLKEMNVSEKGIEKILKWQGVDGVEVDDDGKIANAKDLKKSVKEEWEEYIVTSGIQGADTPNPPANTGGAVKSREEILAIKDASERQAAMAENPELFGI